MISRSFNKPKKSKLLYRVMLVTGLFGAVFHVDAAEVLDINIATAMRSFGDVSTDINHDPGVDYGKFAPSGVDTEIQYSTGGLVLTEDDIVTEGLIPWGQRRSYFSTSMYVNNRCGERWMVNQIPVMYGSDSNNSRVTIYTAAHSGITFKFVGSAYQVTGFGHENFRADSNSGIGNIFRFVDTNGNRTNFVRGAPGYPRRWHSYQDAYGNLIQTDWDDGASVQPKLKKIWQTHGGNLGMELIYGYGAGSAPGHLITSVTYNVRKSGVLQTVRAVHYEYYSSSDVQGGGGDTLKRATIKSGSGQVLGQRYYRYWPVKGPDGDWLAERKGVLKMLVTPRTYARIGNPEYKSDSWLKSRADRYWEFDEVPVHPDRPLIFACVNEIKRGTPEIDGPLERVFTYEDQQVSVPPINSKFRTTRPEIWKRRITEEAKANGSRVFVRYIYTNFNDEVILTCRSSSFGSNDQWIDYYKYDDAGRMVYHATPSAMTGYNRNYDDLLNFSTNGRSTYIRNTSGLIEHKSYYTTTSGGAVKGLLHREFIQAGETSPIRKVSEKTYTSKTGN